MLRQTLNRSGLFSRVYEGAWLARALAASLLNPSPLQGVFCSSSRSVLCNGQVPEAVASVSRPPCAGEQELQNGEVFGEESFSCQSQQDSEMYSAQLRLSEVAAWDERTRAVAEAAHREQLEYARSQEGNASVAGSGPHFKETRQKNYKTRQETVTQIVNRIVADKEAEARIVVDRELGRWLKEFASKSARETAASAGTESVGSIEDQAALRRYICYMQVARTANLVVRTLGKRECPQLALEVFRWMQRQGWCQLDPHLFTTSMKIMGDIRRLEVVHGLFQDMQKIEGMRLDTTSYNAALSAFFRCGKFADAMAIFERMKNGDYKHCQPCTFTYNIVISACGREGLSLARIGSFFKEMQNRGIEPDIVTYTTLISICAQRRLVKEAEQFYMVAKKKGLKLNVVTYTALIWAYGKAGFPEAAWKVYEEMKYMGCRPNVKTFSTLLNASMATEKSVESVAPIIQEMHDMQVPTSTVIYNQLIAGYIREDRLEEAWETLMRMRRTNCKPNMMTFATIMKAYSRSGNHETVLRMYEDLRREGSKLSVYLFTAVIDACAKMGNIDRISGIMRHMKQARVEPNIVTSVAVLWALGKCKTSDEAAGLIESFQIFDSAVVGSICKLVTAPSFDEDSEAKDLILSIFDAFQDKDMRSLTIFCGALVDSLWNLGLRRRAALVLAVAMQHVRLLEGACIFQTTEWTLDIRNFSGGCARVAFYQWLARLHGLAWRLGPPQRLRSRWSPHPPAGVTVADTPLEASNDEEDDRPVERESKDVDGNAAYVEPGWEMLSKEDEGSLLNTEGSQSLGSHHCITASDTPLEVLDDKEGDLRVARGNNDTDGNAASMEHEGTFLHAEERQPEGSEVSDGREDFVTMDGSSASHHHAEEVATSAQDGGRDVREENDSNMLGEGEGWDWAVREDEDEDSGDFVEDEKGGEVEILLPVLPFTAPMELDEGYLEAVRRFPRNVVVVTGSGMLKQQKVSTVRASVEAEVLALGAPFQRGSLVPGWKRMMVRGEVLRAWLRQPGLHDRLQLRDVPTFDTLGDVTSPPRRESAKVDSEENL